MILFYALRSALALCIGAQATVFTPEGKLKQISSVDLVADIRVEALRGVPDRVLHAHSVATARVIHVHSWRGQRQAAPLEGETIQIKTIGGETGGVGVWYSGYPRPYKDREYTATLKDLGNGYYEPIADNGLVDLNPARGPSRNRTDGSDGNGTGPFLYWDRTQFPLPYFIGLPGLANKARMVEAIDLSFKTWRDPPGVTLEFVPMGCVLGDADRNDGINTVLYVTENWPFDPDAIAITRNFYVSGYKGRAGLILDTDILLNARHHAFSTDGAPDTHDVQNIMTHEVGHFIGLGHEVPPVDEDAVMYDSAQLNETKKRHLSANDLLGLRMAYPGAGSKHHVYPTSAACNVEQQAFSCLSVRTRSPARTRLLGPGAIALLCILGLGRWIAQRRKGQQSEPGAP